VSGARGWLSGRRFDYWETVTPDPPEIDRLYRWIGRHMDGYTGCLNLETLGGMIIEAHLRMGDIKRIPDTALLQAVVDVYAGGGWHYDRPPPEYYLMVLWGEADRDYRIDPESLAHICRDMALVDLYDPRYRHENPPGALRVAQLGTFDLESGLRTRARLAAALTRIAVLVTVGPAVILGLLVGRSGPDIDRKRTSP